MGKEDLTYLYKRPEHVLTVNTYSDSPGQRQHWCTAKSIIQGNTTFTSKEKLC